MVLGRVRGRLLALLAAGSVAALVGPLTAPAGATGSVSSASRGQPLTVMTRNLYLGANIQRPVLAALTAQSQGKTPTEVAIALANATHRARATVDRTDFRVRSRLLAAEIAQHRPSLIGLQEVALWRSGPLQLDQVGVPNAETVDYDFLQLLLDALAAKGVKYRAVNVAMRADVEAPSFTGSPLDGTIGGTQRDVRMTMRDVILRRVGAKVRISGKGDVTFTHNLAVTVAGREIEFARGYQWIDARLGNKRFRFTNTHTEAFSSDIALGQIQEVVAGSPTNKNVIVVCDCNSDPLNDRVKSIDHVPHKAGYDHAIASGFTDEWLRWAPAEQGWTYGLSENVDAAAATGFDHRIDMIFARSSRGAGYSVSAGAVTGTSVEDRDPVTGLWPSDHGGVVLRLRLVRR